jgi:hypothetical protein
MIPIWNWSLEDYVETIFFFVEHFLSKKGRIILFYPDDLWVQKEIVSFFYAHEFTIKLKWMWLIPFPLSTLKIRLVKYVTLITWIIYSPYVCNSRLHLPLSHKLLCIHLLTGSSSLHMLASNFSSHLLQSLLRDFLLWRRMFFTTRPLKIQWSSRPWV